ncbi:MAG: extracellular solute-binding protein [Burkholderiales bacterium]|nr:extracellular solute-binding protein [Burkholderiales bacterium]
MNEHPHPGASRRAAPPARSLPSFLPACRPAARLAGGLRALGTALCAVALAFSAAAAGAQDKVLNLYSARHYQADEALYSDFTKTTGIRINRIEAGDEALLERLRNEGRNSPADVLMLVDAARLWKAEEEGLFQPLKSPVLEARIPAHLRSHDSGAGSHWFSFSLRARVIVHNAAVDGSLVRSYEDLARPELKGKVCTRSGAHPYMLSLIGAVSEHLGEPKAEQWARGVVGNFARKPRGGDTEQIKAVAAGECGVALTNTYYLVRLMRSDKADDKAAVAKLKMVWPNQNGVGTHVNVSGAGLAKHAPNRSAAIRFLEYLASDSAQVYFAVGNNEWPVVKDVKYDNPALQSLGTFKADTLPIGAVGRAQAAASRIIDRAGWR